jgi:hypothetical protein
MTPFDERAPLTSLTPPVPAISCVTEPLITASNEQRKWERSKRPPAHPFLGKTSDEQRAWIRAAIEANIRKAEKKSASTIQQYKRKAAYLDRFRDENGILDVSRLGNNASTFYANRAAVVFVATVRAKNALAKISGYDKEISKARRAGDIKKLEWAKNKKEEQWHLLLIAGNDLAMYPAGRSGSKLPAQNDFAFAQKQYKGQTKEVRAVLFEKPIAPETGAWRKAVNEQKLLPQKPNKAKRRATARLQKRHPNWRDQVFEIVSERWKLHTAVASITGCRPEELEGISVQLRKRADPDHPGHFITDSAWLTFGIKGAKTNKGHGQPYREMHLQESASSAFQYLLKLVQEGMVKVSAPTLNGKPLKNPTAAFRMAIKKAGETFMHGNELKLSPYCFRHSFACDLKANGYSAELIGVALSHCSTKTQSRYGRTNDGVKGRRILEIDGPFSIKNDAESRFGRRSIPAARAERLYESTAVVNSFLNGPALPLTLTDGSTSMLVNSLELQLEP